MTDLSHLPPKERSRLVAMTYEELYGEILAVRRDRDMWADVADQMFNALKRRTARAGGESPTPPAPPRKQES